jgi:hypothetical protein
MLLNISEYTKKIKKNSNKLIFLIILVDIEIGNFIIRSFLEENEFKR